MLALLLFHGHTPVRVGRLIREMLCNKYLGVVSRLPHVLFLINSVPLHRSLKSLHFLMLGPGNIVERCFLGFAYITFLPRDQFFKNCGMQCHMREKFSYNPG